MNNSNQNTGKVKFFHEKGYGFIKPSDGSEDIFVHISGIIGGGKLEEGDEVSYDIGQGKKGENAINVEKL